MAAFDWHASKLTRETPLTENYRTTQNVRRFLAAQLEAQIHLDRPFMAWIRSGAPKNMGDPADELARRRPGKIGGPKG